MLVNFWSHFYCVKIIANSIIVDIPFTKGDLLDTNRIQFGHAGVQDFCCLPFAALNPVVPGVPLNYNHSIFSVVIGQLPLLPSNIFASHVATRLREFPPKNSRRGNLMLLCCSGWSRMSPECCNLVAATALPSRWASVVTYE